MGDLGTLEPLAGPARRAASELASVPSGVKDRALAAMADALASEHSARMVAMGSARKNAGELVDSLTLTRNRLRQAAITREISELVGGAEALN